MAAQEPAPTPAAQAPTASEPHTVLRTTVRRVVLDVVVTGPKGAPVPGLTKGDFTVTEDGKPQQILSFDANGFSPEMDYVPPTLPPQPPNTFISLPTTPERGPLYILLYDLDNIDTRDQQDTPDDHSAQLIARQQMMKFIKEKPEGARFAIYVRSDGLHLIQGFTSDKVLLYAAIDPHNPKPHIPPVFLMSENHGQGDRYSAVGTLHALALDMEGLPGRKNLIWFSSGFPLQLFAGELDGPSYREQTKETLDLLAHNQIAVYPVDARGVPLEDSHVALGDSVRSDATPNGSSATGGNAAAAASAATAGPSGPAVQGESAVMGSFQVMDAIAEQTGGRAFHGTNDVAGELVQATESGAVYYTLTYAPTNKEYNGNLRNIHVNLDKKGFEVAYRRSYYGMESPAAGESTPEAATKGRPDAAQPPAADTLSINMQHGAPQIHGLVFIVQAHKVGAPREGTPQEMAELATEPAYFRSRRKTAAAKPLAPIPLQKHVFNFEIPKRQFKNGSALDLEVATAVFDADGRMMNAIVGVAKKDAGEASATGEASRFYRVEQDLEVPRGAASVRFAVRDTTNDRTGALEIKLPLAPESDAAPYGR